ncbi:MAG: preprotein translocase subunit SecG [Desulfobulbaceae bacterium A2]|nr:MAG: preprotein translocase subunit SecG [Desulfobulbaceae bacterium A2]
MTILLIAIHVLVCVFLIGIVLLQHGRGADIGASFGGSSQSLFGTEGPLPLLNKITTISAVVFMITSMALAYISTNKGAKTVMRDLPAVTAPAPEPAVPPGPVTIPMGEGAQPAADPVDKPLEQK